jgi:hypothetical protein
MYPPAALVAPHPLVLARDLRRRAIELVAPPANCWEDGQKNGVIQLQSSMLSNSALIRDRAFKKVPLLSFEANQIRRKVTANGNNGPKPPSFPAMAGAAHRCDPYLRVVPGNRPPLRNTQHLLTDQLSSQRG